MNTRFRLVTALALALATGFAGVASAETAAPAKTAPAMTAPVSAQANTGTTTPARTATKAPLKTGSIKKPTRKAHRAHVLHRTMKNRKLAHRMSTRKATRASLLRKHIARSHRLGHQRHAMNHSTKGTVIR